MDNAKREQRKTESIWLNYFNRYLFECGTISEKEYKLMTEKIAVFISRKGGKKCKKSA